MTASMRALVFCLATLVAAPAWAQDPVQTAPSPPDAVGDAPVEAKVDPKEDGGILQRIQTTFNKLDRLKSVHTTVDAAIVELSGAVLTREDRAEAERLARRVEGVVTVENKITIERNLPLRLSNTFDQLGDSLYGFVAFLPVVLVAALIVLAFWLLGTAITRWTWLFKHFASNEFVHGLVCQVVRAALLLVGLVLALQVLDAVALVSAVLGTAGLVGLVLGLAFRDMTENYVAGVLLSVRQPFLPHDVVKIEGYEGKIVRLTSRSTVIMTWDGNHVRIPNSTVYKAIICNFTQNPQRRFDFVIGVGMDEDLSEAMRVGVETIAKVPGVLETPEPASWVEAIGESSVAVHYFGWHNQKETSFPIVKGEAIRQVKLALNRESIEMPSPTYNLLVSRAPLESSEPIARVEAPPPPVPAVSPERQLDDQIVTEREEHSDRDMLTPEARPE